MVGLVLVAVAGLALAVWDGGSQPLVVAAPVDDGPPWAEAAVDGAALAPAAKRSFPSGARLLGWLPDGRLAAWKGDRLWLVSRDVNEPVEEVVLERPLVWDLWRTKFTFTMGALVFDWHPEDGRFIALAEMPAKDEEVDYESRVQLTEFDAETGQIIRKWTNDELGGSPWKTRYVADGNGIAAGVWGGELSSMHQGWSLGWELFFFMASEYHVSPGAPVVFVWDDGRIERLPADVGDLMFREGTPYVVGVHPGTRLSVLGQRFLEEDSSYSIAHIQLSDRVDSVVEECFLASPVAFVPSPGADAGDIYVSHSVGGGGTASTTIARYHGAAGSIEPLLVLTSPFDERSNPVWATVVVGRGLFVSTTPNGSWSFKCYLLDGSRQCLTLESIVPAECDVRFSADGKWMAVSDHDGALCVYEVEDLLGSLPADSADEEEE